MANQHFSENCKITTVVAVAAGTSTITGAALNMAGFDGALFIAVLGTPATNNNLRVSQCDTTGGTYADLLGTLVGNHATDNPLVVDIYRPQEQFLKYVVTRGTSSSIDSVVIIQYGGRRKPVTQTSGLQVERFNGPIEGTA